MEVIEKIKEENEVDDSMNPYDNFLDALKSPEVRRQYPKLLKIFLDAIKFVLDKIIEERAYLLFQQSISKKKWLFNIIAYYFSNLNEFVTIIIYIRNAVIL